MGFGVWGLGFGVWGLGFGVWGLGFGVWVFFGVPATDGTFLEAPNRAHLNLASSQFVVVGSVHGAQYPQFLNEGIWLKQ